MDILQRNRIISGLAECVVITEARNRSGSLNTAKHAIEQRKEVLQYLGILFIKMERMPSPLRQGVVPILDLTEWSEQWGVIVFGKPPKHRNSYFSYEANKAKCTSIPITTYKRKENYSKV